MYKQPYVLSVYALFNVLFACINLFIKKKIVSITSFTILLKWVSVTIKRKKSFYK